MLPARYTGFKTDCGCSDYGPLICICPELTGRDCAICGAKLEHVSRYTHNRLQHPEWDEARIAKLEDELAAFFELFRKVNNEQE